MPMPRHKLEEYIGYVVILVIILVLIYICYWILAKGERSRYPSVEKLRSEAPLLHPSAWHLSVSSALPEASPGVLSS